jgi:DNA-binding MarR family transcriptional regulator
VSTTTSAELLSPTELGAWRGLLAAHASLTAALDAQLRRAHGLPLTSYEVLLFLADAPDGQMRMAELADSVLLSRSGLTRLVDRLERDRLIERRRCGEDARGLFAVITPAGRELFDRARVTHLAGVRDLFLERFSDAELRALGAFWRRLLPSA